MKDEAHHEEDLLRRITVDPRIFGGKPIIRGTDWLLSMSSECSPPELGWFSTLAQLATPSRPHSR